MTLHHRIVACLLACSVAATSVGCTSMKTIDPSTDPATPTFGRVKRGDVVLVQTRDGRRVVFEVQQIDGNALVSREGARYMRGDMARLQRRSFSGWKTGVLIGGSIIGFLAVVVMVAIGQGFGDWSESW